MLLADANVTPTRRERCLRSADVATEVLLRCQAIVEAAAEREIVRSWRRAGAALLCQRCLACSFSPDHVATEVLLRRQSIVGAAAQREIVDRGWPSSPMRMLVMELQSGLLPAALAAGIDIRAARFVPLPDATANFGRNVPTLVRITSAGS